MGNENVERFINRTIHYFTLIGFEFEENHRWMKLVLIAGILNMCLVLLHQLVSIPFADTELEEKAAGISYMNYYIVSTGKITAWLYNQKVIHETIKEFRQIYPSVQVEQAYNLQTYLKRYLLIERVLVRFFHSIALFYTLLPLVLSLADLLAIGTFSYRTVISLGYPIDIRDHWLIYAFAYALQVISSYESGIIILGSDLYLFSSLLQLCMHFDLINRNILNIEPDVSNKAEKQMKVIIAYHQRVLRLGEKMNNIFTPPILLSLLSSSFVFCFTGYQLLGDVSMIAIVKAIFLLIFEMKQAVITCFLCDRLTELSLETSDAIYEHKWYNGTPKYKRMVLITLMRSQKGVSLNIAGITNLSRQTLREVVSISYKVFTVLKSA